MLYEQSSQSKSISPGFPGLSGAHQWDNVCVGCKIIKSAPNQDAPHKDIFIHMYCLLHVSNEDGVLKWHYCIPGGAQQPIWSNKFFGFFFFGFFPFFLFSLCISLASCAALALGYGAAYLALILQSL